MYLKDIARKPFFVRTDKGDAIHPPPIKMVGGGGGGG